MTFYRCTLKKIALVTGGNRGIGTEVCRQLARKECKVILTSRSETEGFAKAKELSKSGLDVTFLPLDIASAQSVHQAFSKVQADFGRLDILVNNAGVFLEAPFSHPVPQAATLSLCQKEILIKTFEVNTVGAFLMCQSFIPLMTKNNYGRVVNVSSQMGQFASLEPDWPAYRISKTALNAVTKMFAEETRRTNVLVNSVHPGWVRTDMGGASGSKSVEEGTDTIVWAALFPDEGLSGCFFRERTQIPW